MIASFSPAATEDAAKNLSDEFSLRYSLFQGSVKNIRTTLSVFLSQHKTSLLDLRIQMEPFGRRKSAQIRYVQSLARGQLQPMIEFYMVHSLWQETHHMTHKFQLLRFFFLTQILLRDTVILNKNMH